MKYEFKYDGYTTGSREEFVNHLLTLDREGKERTLMAFWESIEVEDCCDGDNLAIISNDIIEHSELLFKLWMNSLLDDMEERAQYMYPDEGWTYGCITVTEEGE